MSRARRLVVMSEARIVGWWTVEGGQHSFAYASELHVAELEAERATVEHARQIGEASAAERGILVEM